MAGEWQEVRLGELGEVNRGRSRHRPRDASHLYGGPYPFIQTGDIKASHGLITRHSQTYSEAGLAQSRLWPAQTMVITIAANIAETAILTYPACFPDSVVGFIADQQKADIRFVEYLFRQLRRQIQHENVGTGSVQDNINLQTLARLVLRVPELPEQKAIAHILGTLDDKIELNRRRNQTLEAMARALFQDWFVDFGPVRAKMACQEAYPPADLWNLFPDGLDDEGKPKGWRERPLDEIADFLNGLALQKFPAIDPDDSLPVIKIAELRNGVSSKSDRAAREVPAKYIIKDGDFLFSWSGSLLAKFWTEGEGALNQHLFKVTSESYPMWFVSHWVHHHLEEFQAIAASKATTMGHIQRGHLKAAMALCPPENVLERLGVVMAPLVAQSIHNEVESRSLAQLRDTLLPKLISGELRIAEAENLMEAIA